MPANSKASPMFAELMLAGFVSLSRAERLAEFDGHEQNTLRDCGAEILRSGDCRLPPNLTSASIEARLAGKDTAWWRDGDQFVVVARRDTDQAYLCCSARGRMDRIDGDLWALRLRVADLDKATIDVFVKPDGETYGAYRGPLAPPKPEMAQTLKGRIVQLQLKSEYLRNPRNLTIYLPPGHDPSKTSPVVYMADGASRQDDPKFVEPLILKGELPPLIMVEIWQGASGNPNEDLRSEEYLLGWREGAGAFLRHESFVLKEVLPAMERLFGASHLPRERLITGFSSGAAWAVSMGLRHPDVFPNVAAQSIVWSQADSWFDGPGATRFFLSAGTLEPNFYAETLKVAQRAKETGHEVVLKLEVSGHTPTIWHPLLLDAFKWAFGAKTAPDKAAQ